MKQIFSAAVALILIIPSLSSAATFTYGGWVPFWKQINGTLDAAKNLDRFHNISPFSYEVKPDGTLVDVLKINDGFWPVWLAAARDLKVKIIPSIAWFRGAEIHALFSDKKKRIAHEDAITALVVKQKFDGIDIDYENKLAETNKYFSLFIQGLANRLHAKKKILSCTIEPRTPLASLFRNPPKTVERANDYRVLNKYCDEVRVMAYDQGLVDIKLNAAYGNGKIYAPVADPLWVKKVISEATKYIKPKKVVLGIPTYGYEYQVAWEDNRLTYERLRSHTFFQAMNRAEITGGTPTRNIAGELSFTYTTSTWITGVSSGLSWSASSTRPSVIPAIGTAGPVLRFISVSDAESAAQKIALAKKLGLRGVVFFKWDGEQDPLLWGKMKR
ncbi:hypothetical protein HY504_01305 [Candidatus Wolfebacteria bacterium]|nr:hypothetical protein [Candidatus Wolfebacteria bacterium]